MRIVSDESCTSISLNNNNYYYFIIIVSDQSCRENQDTHFEYFFLTVNRAVHEIEKCATDDNIASCALHAG